MDNQPKVSVIIRNRNESHCLEMVLKALSLQHIKPVDMILVDNQSEDDSVKIGMQFGCKIVPIRKSDFSYGRALNLGIRRAEGDICVLLSAHCLPIGPYFISECVRPFSNKRVAAVRCINVKNLNDIKRWMDPAVLSYPTDIHTVTSMGPAARGCAIRKKIWEEIPFDEHLEAVEDKFWAWEAVKKGYTIYSPCGAAYLYMDSLSRIKKVAKAEREYLAFYRKTGIKRYNPAQILFRLVKAVCITAPGVAIRSALRVISEDGLRSYYRLILPLRAKTKPKKGSVV